MGVSQLGQKTQYTAPLNVLNDLAQDKVCNFNLCSSKLFAAFQDRLLVYCLL